MAKLLNPEEMTSRDYYFDSYAHFGIHEVTEGPVRMVLPSSIGVCEYARWKCYLVHYQVQEIVSAKELLSLAADDKNILIFVTETLF